MHGKAGVNGMADQLDDEGPQQRQEALDRPHCRARVRDHPPPQRPEPHPGPLTGTLALRDGRLM